MHYTLYIIHFTLNIQIRYASPSLKGRAGVGSAFPRLLFLSQRLHHSLFEWRLTSHPVADAEDDGTGITGWLQAHSREDPVAEVMARGCPAMTVGEHTLLGSFHDELHQAPPRRSPLHAARRT